MSERLLEVDGLCVEFATRQGTVHAVRDVSFHVNKGEILGIVGESGSGKSISVLSCMGLLASNGKIVSGSIQFNGQELSPAGLTTKRELRAHEDMMSRLRGDRIGMIFQDPMTFLNPVLTIGTQLTEGIRTHTKCTREQAAKRAVEMMRSVGIPSPERRMKQYPYEFSGGMRQRVIIAIALACNPELLIADEPTTALDVTVQAQVLEMIRDRTRAQGTSVIMITHDLGVVATLCERIVILYGGKVVEEGSADEIFYEAKHPYTLGLLSSVARHKQGTGGSCERLPLTSIRGTPPDLLKINSGCPFASRCPQAMKICKDYPPARTVYSGTHACSCWLYCRDQAEEIVKRTDAAGRERENG